MKTPKNLITGILATFVLVTAGTTSVTHAQATEKPVVQAKPVAEAKPAPEKKADADKKTAAKTDAPKADAPKEDAQKSGTIAAKATGDESAWVTRCDDMKEGEKVVGKYCEAVQSLSVAAKDADPSTAKRVIEVAIGYPPAFKDKASAVVILPLGIAVNKDIVVEIDGSKLVTTEPRYCDPNGCFGVIELSNGDINKLRKGKEMTVKSQLFTAQPLEITLSLNGLNGALDTIKPKS